MNIVLEGKQPLVKLKLSVDLQEVNRVGIPLVKLAGLSDEIKEKVKNLLSLISPDLIVVDESKNAGSITSFECNPPGPQIISAIFRGFVK